MVGGARCDYGDCLCQTQRLRVAHDNPAARDFARERLQDRPGEGETRDRGHAVSQAMKVLLLIAVVACGRKSDPAPPPQPQQPTAIDASVSMDAPRVDVDAAFVEPIAGNVPTKASE